ncbi:hypothetical protein AAMO2058_000023700 [Amorphochlora amoebiformis]
MGACGSGVDWKVAEMVEGLDSLDPMERKKAITNIIVYTQETVIDGRDHAVAYPADARKKKQIAKAGGVEKLLSILLTNPKKGDNTRAFAAQALVQLCCQHRVDDAQRVKKLSFLLDRPDLKTMHLVKEELERVGEPGKHAEEDGKGYIPPTGKDAKVTPHPYMAAETKVSPES